MSIEDLSTLSRDQLVYLSRMAEQSERYEEMIQFVRAFINHGGELTVEERNILSVGYKNCVGNRRSAWRILSSIEKKEERRGNADQQQRAVAYRGQVEEELKRYCNEICSIVDQNLLPNASSAESRAFYWKMKGDYYRYIAEFVQGSEKDLVAQQADAAYNEARKISDEALQPTHPTRLGLALNYSVFYYEILAKTQDACDMAQKAFDEAIPGLDDIPESDYKDTTLILQLLRDNLTLWKSDQEDAQ